MTFSDFISENFNLQSEKYFVFMETDRNEFKGFEFFKDGILEKVGQRLIGGWDRKFFQKVLEAGSVQMKVYPNREATISNSGDDETLVFNGSKSGLIKFCQKTSRNVNQIYLLDKSNKWWVTYERFLLGDTDIQMKLKKFVPLKEELEKLKDAYEKIDIPFPDPNV